MLLLLIHLYCSGNIYALYIFNHISSCWHVHCKNGYFQKIIERIFDIRFDKFIEDNTILNVRTFNVFNKSTSLVVLELIEAITHVINNNKPAIGVFVDLTKAFDTVNRD